jgi:DnaJ domain
MSTLILGLLLLGGGYFGWRYFQAQSPAKRASLLRRAGGALALILALWLLLYGRYLFALPLAFFGYFALWQPNWFSRNADTHAETVRLASVRTALLEMSLDQATGTLSGHVLAGTFTGRELGTLSRVELGQLWRECRAGEAQSRQLLEAYLDRRWPEWRAELPRGNNGSDGGQGSGQSTGNTIRAPMTRQEAFEVLGLASTAELEEIKTAHRNLMKRLHPDQGGSNYLAAKINEAKEVLLGKRA